MTLGKSFVEHGSLAKVSQLEWLGMPTKGTPSQFIELGMDLIIVQDSSWMNMILKLWLTSSMVLMRSYSLNILREYLQVFKLYCNAIHS